MKKALVLTLLMLFSFCFAFADPAESGIIKPTPQIQNFKVEIWPAKTAVSFDFSGVIGGLGLANFTLGYEITRNSIVLQRETFFGLELDQGESGDIELVNNFTPNDFFKEMGKFEVSFPTDINGLKVGDKIKYFIFLDDLWGRRSNVVFFELTITTDSRLMS